jgi:hypothetical protein
VNKWAGCVVMALVLAACATSPRKTTQSSTTGGAPPTSVAELAAAIKMDAGRSDHESDPKVRGDLATEATGYAGACLALDTHAAACLYGHAVAMGLEARAHPTRATQLLNNMLEALANAEAADPRYDQAGPARVRALVLTRAPGWPLGPGDAEAGLAAARRAVALRPKYPPNLLALAEALSKTGDEKGAHENYERARDAAQALAPADDRDDWLREANQALQRK